MCLYMTLLTNTASFMSLQTLFRNSCGKTQAVLLSSLVLLHHTEQLLPWIVRMWDIISGIYTLTSPQNDPLWSYRGRRSP